MLNVLQLAIEWMLLSSLGLFPSTFGMGKSEFLVYPFSSSIATTKPCSISRPQKKRVLLASRSIKNLATNPHLPSFDSSCIDDNDSSPSFFVTTPDNDAFQYPLHHQLMDNDGPSSSSYDDEAEKSLRQKLEEQEPEHYHLPQQHEDVSGDSEHAVQYRYFGKSRSRLRNRDSIPFILLGPSVDHWKMVGQNLASRGFSVMAASLDEEDRNSSCGDSGTVPLERHDKMVEAILEALRWNRAILVGCDGTAVLAIKAALRLAPEGRVAGVLLCGDLTDVRRHTGDVELFLEQNLECPFSVIWDGNNSVMPAADDVVQENHRCLIRGGGSAPHRRLPEQFAWALTRFVEEQIAPSREDISEALSSIRRFKFPESKLITPGGLLVAGRVLASVVFYVSAMKVIIFQYENIYDGILRISNGYKAMSVWPRRVLRLLGEAVLGWKGLTLNHNLSVPEPVFEDTMIVPMLPQQQDHEDEIEDERVEIEDEAEEEPSVEPVPQPTTRGQDSVLWPIPLINPVAV